MFDNLTMEIFYYSLIPVAVLALVTLFVLLFTRNKENSRYKRNYIIKVLLIIMISLVLPLITGYTIWVFKRYLTKGIILSNLGFIIILGLLIIALVVLLIIICRRLYQSFNNKEQIKENEKLSI